MPSRRSLLFLGFLCLLASASAQCEIFGKELLIPGLGGAVFAEFRTDARNDYAELYGGVCVSSFEGRWTILADRVAVLGVSQDPPRLEIDRPQLFLPPWRIEARRIVTEGYRLLVEDARFEGTGLSGRALRLAIDLDSEQIELDDLMLVGAGFRLEGRHGTLTGSTVRIEGALATSCLCAGPPLYLLAGTTVLVDLADQRITMREGTLRLGPASLRLSDELVIGPEGVSGVSLPVRLEYEPDDPARGVTGTGLGVIIPSLKLEEGLSLEAGLRGLDPAHPLRVHILTRYRTEQLEALIGLSGGGPRAEVTLRQPLVPGLELEMTTLNRHEPSFAYWHEGRLALEGVISSSRVLQGALELRGTVFAAATAQADPDLPVSGPRLGAAASARYRSGQTPLGELDLRVGLEGTAYPGMGVSQYGVRLAPSWRVRSGPFSVALAYRRLWTDAGSPFSDRIDRLQPEHRIEGSLVLAGPIGDRAEAWMTFEAAYDFLEGGPNGRFELLEVATGLAFTRGDWLFRPELRLLLGGLFEPTSADPSEARFEASIEALSGDFEVGARIGLDLLSSGVPLDRLEARLAFPIDSPEVRLRPFLAVDFAETLVAGGAPALSGHGLDIAWRTCCGTLLLGYRLEDGEFLSSLGVSFEAR